MFKNFFKKFIFCIFSEAVVWRIMFQNIKALQDLCNHSSEKKCIIWKQFECSQDEDEVFFFKQNFHCYKNLIFSPGSNSQVGCSILIWS